jgi:hypothetical protein
MVIEWDIEGLLDVPVIAIAYDPGGAELQPSNIVSVAEADPLGGKVTVIESVTLVHVLPWKHAIKL